MWNQIIWKRWSANKMNQWVWELSDQNGMMPTTRCWQQMNQCDENWLTNEKCLFFLEFYRKQQRQHNQHRRTAMTVVMMKKWFWPLRLKIMKISTSIRMCPNGAQSEPVCHSANSNELSLTPVLRNLHHHHHHHQHIL